MNITLKQLQVFTVLARHENLSRASEKLFMTKGAVSQALQELERRLGVQLFDRAHPRLSLNHEGRRLLPLADELVERAVDIERSFRPQGSVDPDDHLLLTGCSKTIGNYLMPRVYAAFKRREGWLPAVRIANTRALLRMIASFALDIALIEGEERHPELIFEPWIADEMVVLAPHSHPLPTRTPLPFSSLAGEPWILREQDSGSREFFAHTLAPHLGQHTIAMTLNSPAAITEAVAQGLGITFASRLSATELLARNKIKVISLEQTFPRTFTLCYHSRKYLSTPLRRFLAFCRGWKDTPGSSAESASP